MSLLDLTGTIQNKLSQRQGATLYHVQGASDADIVASVLPTDGTLTIAAQPSYPAQLVLVLTDADSSVGAMTATIVGTDENHDAQTVIETFAAGGTETIVGTERWRTIASITIATSTGASGTDRIKIGTALGGAQDFSFPVPGIWNKIDAAQDDWIRRGSITHLQVTYHHIGGSSDVGGVNIQESMNGSTIDSTPWSTTATSDGFVRKTVEVSAPYFRFNADGDATAQTRLDLEVVALVADPFEVVPEADSTANDQLRDVVGNKADAAVAAVGTTASLLAYVKGILNAIGGAPIEEVVVAPYVFGPQTVQTDDSAARYSIPLINLAGDILADAETEPGTFTVRRVRAGVDTEIIASTAASEAVGVISATVDLTAGGNWDEGDLGYIEFSGITATVGGSTTELPVMRRYFRVTQETDIETKIDLTLADVGDASGSTLGSLLAIVGNPGTDSLAATMGQLADAAAADDPTSADTVVAYLKQIVNNLQGTAGIAAWPGEAAPAAGVSIAEVLEAIHADVTGLNGASMVGTDSAALASVVGVLADAAAAGEITSADTLMAYVKQLINELTGVAGVDVWAAAAAPGNNVSIHEVLRSVYDDTNELQTDWVDAGRLDTILDSILDDTGSAGVVVDTRTTVADRLAGETQTIEVSITAAANAGVTTVATITDQPCIIESVVLHADAAQTGDLTTAAIKGGASQVVEFIGTGDAIQANLDAADKQVAWTGAVRLTATKTITIDLQGTGATATNLTVTIVYRAAVDGGNLA